MDPVNEITVGRRRIIRALGGAGVLGIAGCSGDGTDDDPGTDDGTETDTPDGGTDTPGEETDTPDEGTDTPDDGTDTPDGGTDTPDGGTDTPDGGTDTPDGGVPGEDYEPPAESEWPPRVEPSAGGIGPDPPGDATILWDGDTATLDDWEHSGASPFGGEDGAPAEWYERDGYFETNPSTGDIRPKAEMGDCHLHLEWRVPEDLAEPDNVDIPLGNSGVFMMERYEIAIRNHPLEEQNPDDKTAGSYYASDPALSLPIREQGEWQEFDIFWRAPVFDENNEVRRLPMLTNFMNGVCLNAHVDVLGPNWVNDGHLPFDDGTHGHNTDENGDFVEEAPFYLQDHHSEDSILHWRNVWYRELPERPVEVENPGQARTYDTSQGEGRPDIIDAGGPGTTGEPPEDAETLFDSLTLDPGSGWESEASYGDSQVHLEWQVPEDVDAMGPFRGNSGVLMMGNYEIRILDTADNPVEADEWAGAYTHGAAPHHDAVRGRGEWQHLDIVWQGPRFENGAILDRPAQVTALLNGVAVQTRLRVEGRNDGEAVENYAPHDPERPLSLAAPDSETRFRNGWIRSLV